MVLLIRSSVPSPPGPPGLPLVGNLHQFDSSNPPRYFWILSRQFGPLMSLRLGCLPIVVASSAKMAEEILKTHDLKFCDRANMLGKQILSYDFSDVAFSSYSNVYSREMKKICVVNLLSSSRVQNFRPIREEEVARMIEKISKSNKPVNLSAIIVSLTDLIISRISFGKRHDDEGSEKSRFHELINETEGMLGSFFFQTIFLSWVGLTNSEERSLDSKTTSRNSMLSTRNLWMCIFDPNQAKAEQEDILDVLLGVRKDRGFKVELPWNSIKAMLMTVSATVIWAMTYIVKNPSAMKKAQEEIRNFIGNKGFVDEDDVKRLPYLKALVKETMRLQPPIPLIPRSASETCTVYGYEIPPKTLVFVNLWAVGRDPEAWENPDVFNPDRFIGSCIDFKGQHFTLWCWAKNVPRNAHSTGDGGACTW